MSTTQARTSRAHPPHHDTHVARRSEGVHVNERRHSTHTTQLNNKDTAHKQRASATSHNPPSRSSLKRAMTTQDWASHFWITLIDEEGETFYANPQTGERKWAIPPGSLVLPRSAEGEWYELWSDEHNLPYYYHTVRDETTWYKPDGFVIPLKAVQRFSAGKRFSLSLDTGSSILAPEAPDVSEDSPLPIDEDRSPDDSADTLVQEIQHGEHSSTHDSKCDPFYAAVFRCITGKSTPETPKNKQVKVSSRSRTTSGRVQDFRPDPTRHVPAAAAAVPLYNILQDADNEQEEEAEEGSGLDHLNISNLSMASSNGTLSTSASTPLNTPKVLQQAFSKPDLRDNNDSIVQTAAFLQESPYIGIEETKETITITADDLIGALSPTVVARKSKNSAGTAPLKIRKRTSIARLGEALALRSPPAGEEDTGYGNTPRDKAKKKATPTLDISASGPNTKAALEAIPGQPKTPGTPGTPGTPHSPSSFFSAVFGKTPVSPGSPSSVTATFDDVHGQQQSNREQRIPATPSVVIESGSSPRGPKLPKELKSPTMDKVKKMFASSQDLFKQSDAPPKDIRRSVTDLFVSKPTSPTASNSLGKPPSHVQPPDRAVSPVPQDLLDEIHRFSFNQYAQEHFAGSGRRHTRIFHKKMLPLEQRMKWQSGDLDAPILQLNKQLRWDALQCFTHLQRVMGDRPLKDSDIRISMEDANAPSAWDCATTEEARKLLAFGVNVPELRDEIYVQLLCQLSDNPSAISIYRGYQLLQVLLLVFPPSPSLGPTLRQFLVARRGSVPRSRLGIIARYALVKLDDIVARGPRGAVPTLFEVQAASEGAFQPSVFGETLQRVMALQVEAYPDAKIPIVLSFLADGVLALGGLKTPGIFRVAGDIDKVKEFRIILDQGRYSFAGYEDPRIAASLFKLWLRDLRDPLIPVDWYHQCMEAAPNASRCIEIIQKLPSINRRIVAFVISFLQIFSQEVVVRTTLVPAASLAMIFTPSFFRGPPVSKTFNASASGTHETISKVFNEARIEQQFMLNILECLDVTRLEDEDDWIPTHGKHNSLASSTTSTNSSSFQAPTSFYNPTDTSSETSRPSLDSTTSTSSLSSRPSFGHTKRKHQASRIRTRTAEPTAESRDASTIAPGVSTSASLPLRSRAVTDSVFLNGKSQSSKDLSARMARDMASAPDMPLPDLPFIKPLIVVDEAE